MARGKGGRGGRASLKASKLEFTQLQNLRSIVSSADFLGQVAVRARGAKDSARKEESCAGAVQSLGSAMYHLGILTEGVKTPAGSGINWKLIKDEIKEADQFIKQSCMIIT